MYRLLRPQAAVTLASLRSASLTSSAPAASDATSSATASSRATGSGGSMMGALSMAGVSAALMAASVTNVAATGAAVGPEALDDPVLAAVLRDAAGRDTRDAGFAAEHELGISGSPALDFDSLTGFAADHLSAPGRIDSAPQTKAAARQQRRLADAVAAALESPPVASSAVFGPGSPTGSYLREHLANAGKPSGSSSGRLVFDAASPVLLPAESHTAFGTLYAGVMDGVLQVFVRRIPADVADIAALKAEARSLAAHDAEGCWLSFRGIERDAHYVYVVYSGPAVLLRAALVEAAGGSGPLATLGARLAFCASLLRAIGPAPDLAHIAPHTVMVNSDGLAVLTGFDPATCAHAGGSDGHGPFSSLAALVFYIVTAGSRLGAGARLASVRAMCPVAGPQAAHLVRALVDGMAPLDSRDPASVLQHPAFLAAEAQMALVAALTSRVRAARTLAAGPPSRFAAAEAAFLASVESALAPLADSELAAFLASPQGWKGAFDEAIVAHLGAFRAYDSGSVLDLVFFVRNFEAHASEFPDEVLRLLADTADTADAAGGDVEEACYRLRIEAPRRRAAVANFVVARVPSLACSVFAALQAGAAAPSPAPAAAAPAPVAQTSWTTVVARGRRRDGMCE
ncbi:uncharacterized protein AMSG_03061 [Thecamonas trahens ATCC 50062]|uniref:KEN domain-containing protein n=1 Tax=Thecamonas trahens ATCC 50062 TaxID=461836 RepID=A0A0L0D2V0_THETB|nr:hypothetical protein AMSG_03061 [Thecamonas trahens ATCC 50062]KNC46624.1 hypothetical protein AMSG_03061 [Thecamonas trahens ATCC 50062]|eukprot:XP_013760397.1 hypothetical protein AMSG_03061 [Thecamonas trahens ATCC 50062]